MSVDASAADAPLLFLDSGIGGLSVLGPTLALLPQAPLVYAADFAGLPYGEKTEMEVATRVCALLGRLTERFRPRLVVIACNTASTIALAHVRSVLEVPVVGTVPAIKPAALATQSGVIGLLGTEATLRQPYVDRLADEFAVGKLLLRHAAPELVGQAEAKLRGEATDPAVFAKAMSGLVDQHPQGITMDEVVLGCTHFPLVREELLAAARALGLPRNIGFVDGGEGIARRIATLTVGQAWPSAPQRIALFNGDARLHDRYRPALARYGITEIQSV
jgi:glutamate racemase